MVSYLLLPKLKKKKMSTAEKLSKAEDPASLIRRNPRLARALSHNPQAYARTKQDPMGTLDMIVGLLDLWSDDQVAQGGLDAAYPQLWPRKSTVEVPPTIIPQKPTTAPQTSVDTPLSKKARFDGQSRPTPPQKSLGTPKSLPKKPSSELPDSSSSKGSHAAEAVTPPTPHATPPSHVSGHDAILLGFQEIARNVPGSAATLVAVQQVLASKNLTAPMATASAQMSLTDVHNAERAQREKELRNMTAGSIIRAAIGEFVIERRTNMVPCWGGRLVPALRNPRQPFGVGAASDALDLSIRDFSKDCKNLLEEIVRNNGRWPVSDRPWMNDLVHHAFALWTRRLVRPVLMALVDSWRRELASLNEEPRPSPYLAQDLDKDLHALKDIQGDWYITPANKDKKR